MNRSIFFLTCIILLVLFSGNSSSAQRAINLISNPSLEDWKNHFPTDWRVVSNTPDVFKSNVSFTPGVNYEFIHPTRTITEASHGYSFANLINTEILEVKLKTPLEKGKTYTFRCDVNRLILIHKSNFDKITIRFSNHPAPYNLSTKKITNYTEVPLSDITALKRNEWHTIQTDYIAKGDEAYLQIGVFLEAFEDLGLDKFLINFTIDNLFLFEKNQLKLLYPNNSDNLTDRSMQEILQFLKDIDTKNEFVKVSGFASTSGESNLNLDLSKRRMEKVNSFIQNNYDDELKIQGEYFGDHLSLKDDTTKQMVLLELEPKILPDTKQIENTELTATMKALQDNDQKYRAILDSLMRVEPTDSLLTADITSQMNHQDSLNRITLDSLMTNRKYIGLSSVGRELMDAAFLVILHSPLEYRMKYDSILKIAESEAEFNITLFPYLIDRNLLANGKHQIYGTQCRYDEEKKKFVPFPIKNTQIVDEKRKEFLLPSLDSYLKFMNEDSSQ